MTFEIGERIRSERHRLGLRQTDLADMLGCGVQAVSNWETNRAKPSTGKMQRMVELGFNVAFIFTEPLTETTEERIV